MTEENPAVLQKVPDRPVTTVDSAHITANNSASRRWWDYLIVALAVGVFIWLGLQARIPALAMNFTWLAVLAAVLVASAGLCGWMLWKRTRFS